MTELLPMSQAFLSLGMIKMVVTDLDGTLLRSDRKVSSRDLETLAILGEKGVIRVIATGRSPYSFNRVIPPDFPIDYLVFSSGTGVMDFRTKEVLFAQSLDAEKVSEIVKILQEMEISFKVLEPVPNNHQYAYYLNGDLHPDFVKRMEFYRGFEKAMVFDPPNFGEASQILIILPPDVDRFNQISMGLSGVKVVRATSPLDHESIWMEVFHPEVSKAGGMAFIARRHGITPVMIMSVGNDYNDLDMLAYTGSSFVVANSPDDIRKLYPVVSSHDEDGFTGAVSRVIAV